MSNDASNRAADRRVFLRGVLRYVAASGLLGGMGALMLGQSRESNASDDCVKTIACGGCGAFGSCELARAMAARQHMNR